MANLTSVVYIGVAMKKTNSDVVKIGSVTQRAAAQVPHFDRLRVTRRSWINRAWSSTPPGETGKVGASAGETGKFGVSASERVVGKVVFELFLSIVRGNTRRIPIKGLFEIIRNCHSSPINDNSPVAVFAEIGNPIAPCYEHLASRSLFEECLPQVAEAVFKEREYRFNDINIERRQKRGGKAVFIPKFRRPMFYFPIYMPRVRNHRL